MAQAIPYIVLGTSIVQARQQNAIGKYNQSIQNRNAQIAEQEAGAIDKQTEDGDPAFILLADGTDSGYLQIPVIVSETQDRNKVPLFPYWFLSSGLVSLHCSVAMPEDVVVEFVLQPIIQSIA